MMKKYQTLVKANISIYLDATLYLVALITSFHFYVPGAMSTLGYGMFLVFIPLWLVARIQLWSSFSVLPRAKKLVNSGLYRKIRNPIYLFTEIANLGLALVFNNMYLYIALAVHALVQLYRAKKEESVLRERFGQEYDDYKKGTWF